MSLLACYQIISSSITSHSLGGSRPAKANQDSANNTNNLLPTLTRRRISVSLLPLILRILIPIIQLLRHRPLRALSSLHILTLNPPRLLRPNTNTLTKLQIPLSIPIFTTKALIIIARHSVVVLVAPAALEHAAVVPAASREGEPGA